MKHIEKPQQAQNLGLSVYSGEFITGFSHSHLEIEFSIVERYNATQYFAGEAVERQVGVLTAFWGLKDHGALEAHRDTKVHVIRVPLTEFMQWVIPDKIRHGILSYGPYFFQANTGPASDLELMKFWIKQIQQQSENSIFSALKNIESRLLQEPECDSIHKQIKPDKSSINRFENLALKAIEYLTQSSPISQIAEECGMSTASASRLFKKKSGLTLQEFMTHYRLEYSCALMMSTDTTVDAIARECGYASNSQFYASFERKYKMSPRQYKQDILENAPKRMIHPKFKS